MLAAHYRYKECSDPTGKHFKVIPALDEADLHEIDSYRRGNEMKTMKPFAPHLIVLEDVPWGYHEFRWYITSPWRVSTARSCNWV